MADDRTDSSGPGSASIELLKSIQISEGGRESRGSWALPLPCEMKSSLHGSMDACKDAVCCCGRGEGA